MPKIRLYNPFRKRSSNKRRVRRVKARRRKSNTGGTLTFMANPKKKHRVYRVKHRRPRRKHNPFARRARVHHHRPRRKSNPFRVRRFRRRSRNPFGGGAIGQTAIKALWAIGGGIITRSLPQTILGASNTGIMGYIANAATTAVASMAAAKFFGPAASEGIIIGGAVMTVGRIVEDYLGSTLVSFAQLNMPGSGQPLLSSDRRYALAGDFQNFNFPVPYSSLGPASRPALCPAPAIAKGMAGVWGGGNPWNN